MYIIQKKKIYIIIQFETFLLGSIQILIYHIIRTKF